MELFETFKQLHQGKTPLLLANIWDVNSARIFEASGYKAIGVSSQAVSNAFGYDDGENLPFEILLRLAKRVAEVVSIPFSVDIWKAVIAAPLTVLLKI
jgi:2-methylisocitrate lyase-like PEP mutase family enzyme